jgi:lipopolysaccharide/colanic/teichoic acid biosynthesis glycosyltransferase
VAAKQRKAQRDVLSSVLKRAIDVGISGVAGIAALPVVAAGALLVRLESPGPIFYRAERVGRDGALFRMYKLRTMVVGADAAGPAITGAGDPRITRAGAVLRRTKIDELPQLFNVLAGDMSLVGPRPEHPDFVRLYDERQRQVLSVRPGMTSAASVRFHDEELQLSGSDVEADYRKRILPAKLEIDLGYVERSSSAEDLRILGRTLLLVLGKVKRRRR